MENKIQIDVGSTKFIMKIENLNDGWVKIITEVSSPRDYVKVKTEYIPIVEFVNFLTGHKPEK